MPFDNEVTSSEMASLVALARLTGINRKMVNTGRAMAAFHSPRSKGLAKAILDNAPLTGADGDALAVLRRVSAVR